MVEILVQENCFDFINGNLFPSPNTNFYYIPTLSCSKPSLGGIKTLPIHMLNLHLL